MYKWLLYYGNFNVCRDSHLAAIPNLLSYIPNEKRGAGKMLPPSTLFTYNLKHLFQEEICMNAVPMMTYYF